MDQRIEIALNRDHRSGFLIACEYRLSTQNAQWHEQ
jgi:hypothetical protein